MRTVLAAVIVSALALGGARSAGAQKCGQPFEVAANTPREVIAKMVVDQMFNDIVLTEAQQAKAVTIVAKQMSDASKLDSRAPTYRQEIAALRAKQNTDLMALLTKDDDRAKLTACFKLMDKPGRGGGTSGQ